MPFVSTGLIRSSISRTIILTAITTAMAVLLAPLPCLDPRPALAVPLPTPNRITGLCSSRALITTVLCTLVTCLTKVPLRICSVPTLLVVAMFLRFVCRLTRASDSSSYCVTIVAIISTYLILYVCRMESHDAATAAIVYMNGSIFNGRPMKVLP